MVIVFLIRGCESINIKFSIMSQENKIFKEFTNQYELSKTLRFELNPVWEMQRMLEEIMYFKRMS